MGHLFCRQALLVFLFGTSPSLVFSQESHADYPVGCFSFGYQYKPSMVNISGMPYKLGSVNQCQMKCRATLGCHNFAYFTSSQECWLGSIVSHIVKATERGVVAGPATCPTDPPACSVIPGPGFPGATPAASRAAWPTMFEQPTNLQCWPRGPAGFPYRCNKRMAKVLEDTNVGWPGRCDMGNFREITDLNATETCQMRCFKSVLCGVWMVQNTTGQDVCYQSMNGLNCYKTTGVAPKRAQRIMHGTYRKLMETTGVQIKNQVQVFEVTFFPKWETGAERCRLMCLSYIFCQYWQYSSVYGCWVEDPAQKLIEYPLYNGGGAMNISNGASIKAGEYIQHTCPDSLAMTPLPLDSPSLDMAPVHKTIWKPTPAPSLSASPATEAIHDGDAGGSGLPTWVTILIGLAVALCLAAVAAAAAFVMLNKKTDKKSTRKARGLPGHSAASGHSGSKNSSFASQASQQALMQQNGHGGYGYQGGVGGYGQPGATYNQGYGPQQWYGQQQQPYGQYYPQTQQMPAGYGQVSTWG